MVELIDRCVKVAEWRFNAGAVSSFTFCECGAVERDFSEMP
jgi:hypothetical protein